jgi:type II secretory pathway component GspD/PulD (secretin)
VEDLMELKVFRLKYADPSEMADLLTSLFPDETKTTTSNNNMGGFRFGPGGGGNNAAANSASSDRLKKQSRVLAIADQRTTSIVVSASRYLMANIGQMIEQLDSNPAKKQKVFVYSLENAEVQQVETVLQNLFEGQNSRNTRSSSQNSALTTRSTQSQNQSSSSSFGNNSSTRRSGSGN